MAWSNKRQVVLQSLQDKENQTIIVSLFLSYLPKHSTRHTSTSCPCVIHLERKRENCTMAVPPDGTTNGLLGHSHMSAGITSAFNIRRCWVAAAVDTQASAPATRTAPAAWNDRVGLFFKAASCLPQASCCFVRAGSPSL